MCSMTLFLGSCEQTLDRELMTDQSKDTSVVQVGKLMNILEWLTGVRVRGDLHEHR